MNEVKSTIENQLQYEDALRKLSSYMDFAILLESLCFDDKMNYKIFGKKVGDICFSINCLTGNFEINNLISELKSNIDSETIIRFYDLGKEKLAEKRIELNSIIHRFNQFEIEKEDV